MVKPIMTKMIIYTDDLDSGYETEVPYESRQAFIARVFEHGYSHQAPRSTVHFPPHKIAMIEEFHQ